MKLYTGDALPQLGSCVIAMGTFDGCHNGHLRVLRRAMSVAKKIHFPCVVWTYARHPLERISLERAPLPLQTISQKLRAMHSAGVNAVCLRPFTRHEAETEPEDFIRRLVERVGMHVIVLGRSHTFGKEARGTPAMMQDEGRRRGFRVEIVDTLRICGENVTSSAIREHLAKGDMRRATAMLGHCFSIEGSVIAGKQIGRKIGYPTINVQFPDRCMLPRRGVYAGWVEVSPHRYPCVLNLGTRPTVGGREMSLEAYLLDFKGDLYGKRVVLQFYQFIRSECRFLSIDDLSAQIGRDEKRARAILYSPTGIINANER